jgi:hypothetical protein
MTEKRESEISKAEFLKLPSEEICQIVQQKGKPKVGVFVADGNRRLVMCRTRLSPNSDEFHNEYARFFVDSFKESLDIFFKHGLEILFFPLFGPSLLSRKNKFQSITIPTVYQKLFKSDEGFELYKEKGIRIKAYGDLSQLEKIDVKQLKMAEGIQQMIKKTASHDKHTIFFGFMSENTPGLEMPQRIINFFKSKNRTPTPEEMIEIYYGEHVPPADFFILSGRFSFRALPPLISTQDAGIYYFPVPGFLGLNTSNYSKILYDLLFVQPTHMPAEYSLGEIEIIASLKDFFESHQNKIIGTSKKIGEFLVTSLC